MKSVEVSARTIEDATQDALSQLNTTQDQVDITVLDEGSKGLFGLLTKPAKIFVERKPTIEWKAIVTSKFIQSLLDKMAVPADIKVGIRDDNVHVDITGENLGLLIGRRGQTLDALQYLGGLVVNREGGDWTRVIIDVEGYRNRREETLRALANRLCSKVLATKRRVRLDPMNSLERRIIHNELQECAGVETHSEGKEPYRRVIILPQK